MKTSKPYYFDYMASTPIAGSVKEKMIKYLDADKYYGNPASTHNIYGYYAQQVIAESREKIADYFNSEAENWLFTSGATEAINLAIQGVAYSYSSSSKRIITFESEHAATLKCCKQLRSLGFEIVVLPVQSSGLIDLCLLEEALKTSTLLVSVLHVNNEIGVIQPIKEITDLAKKHHALVHVDAVQTVGKVKLDLLSSGIDLMSISSHKNYGPKGIGSLYISPDNNLKLKPIIFGGGQEKGFRSGTLATHQIAGMGEAYSLSKRDYDEDYNKVESLYKIFVDELIDGDLVILNGAINNRVPHNISLTFAGFSSDVIISHLSNFAFSLGSACQAMSNRPSHVLMAIGHTHRQANNTIRLSIGRYTNQVEVEKLILSLKDLISG